MCWSKTAPIARVCSRWQTVLGRAGCISLWTAGKLPLAWPLCFAFAPLLAHIISGSTDGSYSSFSWQLLTTSPERISAVFKVLGKWFNIPIKGNFSKSQELIMNILTKLNLWLASVAEGVLVCRHLSDPLCYVMILPHTESWEEQGSHL